MKMLVLLALLGAADPIQVKVPEKKGPVSYTKQVADVLDAKCVGCHSSALAENKLNMEEVAGMLKGGKRGPAIKPGKADESLLFQMAAHRVEPVMPPKDKKDAKSLTPEELGVLKLWIDGGAKDDSAENAPAAAKGHRAGLAAAGRPPDRGGRHDRRRSARGRRQGEPGPGA